MELIHNLNQIKQPYNNAVVTIGNFDGVHIGHKELFQQIINEAKNIGGKSVVITFNPHPMKVIKKKKPFYLITPLARKVELIKKIGIDILIIIPFTTEFAQLTAEDFLKKILINKIGAKVIIVGNDYAFGKNRGGNLAFLKQHRQKFNYEVKGISDITGTLNERISSTKVRKTIAAGKIFEVKQLLGRFYKIAGKVIAGRSRGGKTLGFPTANIKPNEQLPPAFGVYAVFVDYQKNTYNGVANVGISPSFGDNLFTIEIHIINFNENIYGEKLGITFIKKIREEKKFTDTSELSEQIKKDIQKGEKILLKWRN
ncbi:MAG: bifunctional riboflavin kinase/FAD synthetase [Deltaproteobacteria bacterium]|nr:bifunctional riboflavin kinase/FAD synthetase [Deltaproteobacteria bacterium]